MELSEEALPLILIHIRGYMPIMGHVPLRVEQGQSHEMSRVREMIVLLYLIHIVPKRNQKPLPDVLFRLVLSHLRESVEARMEQHSLPLPHSISVPHESRQPLRVLVHGHGLVRV